MNFPILEYDPIREAFLEPAKLNKKRDVPQHCVLCFFMDVIEKIVADHNGRILVENRWEDGPHPLYEINHSGQCLAIFHPRIGSALSGALLEVVIAFGCQKFIACGGCGSLQKGVAAGHLLVVSAAVRDEGISYHYLPPTREVQASLRVVKTLVELLKTRGISCQVGKTWTTAAPYRETPAKIKKRREEGCLTVEMEAAGLMAVAEYRQVAFSQLLYAGDDLSGTE